MIKLIVSDIDGTLVRDGENKINQELFDVIMRLKREKQIHFAAASGRQAASIEYTFAPIGKEIFYIAENGAYLGCLGRNLFLYPMKRADAVERIPAWIWLSADPATLIWRQKIRNLSTG